MKAQRALNTRRRTLARELAWGLLDEGGGDSVDSAPQADICDAASEANAAQTSNAGLLLLEDGESVSHGPASHESASAEPVLTAESCDVDYEADWHFEPPPALPPAALRIMFDFAASSTHRYDASRIPLGRIASTVDVEVVEDGPWGRRALARRLIRKGAVLGWFDGIRVRGDPLIDLHPYAYACTDAFTVVGSPLCWAS